MNKRHLPLLGPGPMIGLGQVLILILAIAICKKMNTGFAEIQALKIPFRILGVIIFLTGLYFDYSAKMKSKLFEKVKENMLVTDGIYAYVRNPVYSGILFCCTGVTLFFNNLLLFLVPVLCWGYTTVVLIRTEEKWLKELYGQEYVEYCRRVNRCIPWIPGRAER